MTKKIMAQYEKVRESGLCNMYSYPCVINAAYSLKCFELAAITKDQYKDILLNFNKYMKKFKVKQ